MSCTIVSSARRNSEVRSGPSVKPVPCALWQVAQCFINETCPSEMSRLALNAFINGSTVSFFG